LRHLYCISYFALSSFYPAYDAPLVQHGIQTPLFHGVKRIKQRPRQHNFTFRIWKCCNNVEIYWFEATTKCIMKQKLLYPGGLPGTHWTDRGVDPRNGGDDKTSATCRHASNQPLYGW